MLIKWSLPPEMKKELLSLVFLPLAIYNFNSSDIESVVKSEASGENASVKTEVTNIVNQNVTRVVSTQSGEIKVEVKNGEVKVESSPEASPTVIISKQGEEATNQAEEQETINRVNEVKSKIFSLLEDFFSKFRNIFSFRG